MLNIKNLLTEFVQDESGLTAVEYAIAGGLVAGAMVTAFVNLGANATLRIDALDEAVQGNVVAPTFQ
ncbi:MAG: pilus assembly protein Flp/PilA [Psychromonas sp.]|jgi:pilus assembly protein Flp/PilA|uniref:Flp family type IVb pilin n=1 Tax=Psychromonas sp. TaxID=1884585 RepID=UPI0039E5F820